MMRLGNGGICTQIGKYSEAMLNNSWKKKQCKYLGYQCGEMRGSHCQAITSAELKLLRLRRTFLSPGRPDFGTTTAATLLATQASGVAVAVCLRTATSLNEDVC